MGVARQVWSVYMLGSGSACGDAGRPRGAGELDTAEMEEAAREQGLLDALRALPGVGERAGVGDGTHSEWAQAPEGLAAMRARTALLGYRPARAERAERAAYEALAAAFEAWLAQCCQRTGRDCVPEHVTIFMETVFVPAHLDSTSASGARCCAWQTVQLAMDHLRGVVCAGGPLRHVVSARGVF